ncbi:MAG: hypothetical protein KDD11_01350 [Acidobacteria bacterium]|nr:hypothetical protein [Acidobacteriota bacterium]
MASTIFGTEFTDPYIDFVVSQLLSPREAISLTRPELEVLMASVRGEILFSKSIRDQLQKKATRVVSELRSARGAFPTTAIES